MFQAHFGVCESTDAVTLNIWYTQWRCHSLKKPLLRCCRCLHFNSIIIFCLLRRFGFDCVKSIYVTLMTCHKTIILLYFSLHSKESPFDCYSGRVLCAFETEVEVRHEYFMPLPHRLRPRISDWETKTEWECNSPESKRVNRFQIWRGDFIIGIIFVSFATLNDVCRVIIYICLDQCSATHTHTQNERAKSSVCHRDYKWRSNEQRQKIETFARTNCFNYIISNSRIFHAAIAKPNKCSNRQQTVLAAVAAAAKCN